MSGANCLRCMLFWVYARYRSGGINRTIPKHPLWRLGDWLCKMGRKLGGD